MRDARDRMGKQVAGTAGELRQAQESCLHCVQHCLRVGGVHAEARHIRTLLDCAELCQTTAGFMMRESEFHPRMCGVTAEICEKAAESCEKIKDDEEMRATAQVCRRAAESSRALAGG